MTGPRARSHGGRRALAACAAAVVGTILALAACKAPPAPPSAVFIKAIDETKAPVKDAELTAQGQVIAQTDADGRAKVTLTGREGMSFLVEVRCPQGFRSPNRPVEVRRLENSGAAAPEYVTHCERQRHTLTIDVKTTGATNMPVLQLGKEIAHTDDAGAAHFVIEGDVADRIDLQLDTTDPKLAKVHPQNPTGSFVIANHDDSVAFEVKFTVDKKRVWHGREKKGPTQVH